MANHSAHAQDARPYNVVFIVSDDLRVEAVAYDEDDVVQTPNLDRISEAGMRFEQAYSQFPLCNPSRTSFLTGRYPTTTGVADNLEWYAEEHPDYVTLPRFFKEHGYTTLRSGKLFHADLDDTEAWTKGGEERDIEDGHRELRGSGEERRRHSDRFVVLEGDGSTYSDYRHATQAIEYLQEHKNEPFFLAVGFAEPHNPPTAPQQYYDLYDLDDIPLPPDFASSPAPPPGFPELSIRRRNADLFIGREASPEEARQMIRGYFAATSFMDAQVGRILDPLSPDGKWVLFNSSLLTESDIMLVPLHPLEFAGERSSAARETPSRKMRSRTLPSREAILEDVRLANRYFMEKWPDVDQSMAVANRVWPSNIWTRAVYYEGLMALYEIDPRDEYYQYAVDWGKFHEWNLWGGVTTRNADNQAAGQTYIDLYQIDPQPERIENIKASIDSMMATDKIDDWDWIDAIRMAMPVFAELGVIYDDPSYWDRMHEMYMFTRNAQGDNGLYNPEDGLWWRDADFDPPHTSPAGEDVYWSRGNGWVLMALARVLDVLPDDAPQREQYVRDFRAMAEALVPIQREDGFWNVSLHDPTQYGGPEATGTAMFTYGMAWGINEGILDEKTYRVVVSKAWNAMAEDALHPDGFLGYVQSTGKEPSTGQPVTYDKQPDFEDYGLGAFLLAGSEIYRLVGN